MSWASLILTTIKALATLVGYMRDRKLMKAGQDAEVAKATLVLLGATQHGKELRARIAALDDKGADALWGDMIKDE